MMKVKKTGGKTTIASHIDDLKKKNIKRLFLRENNSLTKIK